MSRRTRAFATTGRPSIPRPVAIAARFAVAGAHGAERAAAHGRAQLHRRMRGVLCVPCRSLSVQAHARAAGLTNTSPGWTQLEAQVGAQRRATRPRTAIPRSTSTKNPCRRPIPRLLSSGVSRPRAPGLRRQRRPTRRGPPNATRRLTVPGQHAHDDVARFVADVRVQTSRRSTVGPRHAVGRNENFSRLDGPSAACIGHRPGGLASGGGPAPRTFGGGRDTHDGHAVFFSNLLVSCNDSRILRPDACGRFGASDDGAATAMHRDQRGEPDPEVQLVNHRDAAKNGLQAAADARTSTVPALTSSRSPPIACLPLAQVRGPVHA